MIRDRRVRVKRREFLAPGVVRVVDRFNADGPLYVLIPGLGAEGEVFLPVARALKAQGKSYVIVEPLGFGYRSQADSKVSLGEAAEAVFAPGVLTEQPAIYVGHSGGALGAIELAKRDPHAAGVVFLNGLLDDISDVINRPSRTIWRHPYKAFRLATLVMYLACKLPEFILKRLEQPRHLLTLLFWPMVAKPRRMSAEALTLLVRHNRCPNAWVGLMANRHYDLASHGPEIKVPLLAMWGKHDPLGTNPKKSRFLARCEMPVRVVALDCGHCSSLEVPGQVAQALVEFTSSPPKR